MRDIQIWMTTTSSTSFMKTFGTVDQLQAAGTVDLTKNITHPPYRVGAFKNLQAVLKLKNFTAPNDIVVLQWEWMKTQEGQPFVIDPQAGYKSGAGTVSVTSGSATVTGVGTAFTTELQVGSTIVVGSHPARTVSAIASNTSLTVSSNFSSTLSTQSYILQYKDQGFVIRYPDPDLFVYVVADPYDQNARVTQTLDIPYVKEEYGCFRFVEYISATGASPSTAQVGGQILIKPNAL